MVASMKSRPWQRPEVKGGEVRGLKSIERARQRREEKSEVRVWVW
jgi:hypothetical protein